MVNWMGLYGEPEKLLLNDSLVVKRPTEYETAQHIFNPNAPRFEEAPDIPSLLFCCRCRGRKPHAAFDVDVRYTLRGGRRTECKDCRAKERKQQRLMKRHKKHQRHADVYLQ